MPTSTMLVYLFSFRARREERLNIRPNTFLQVTDQADRSSHGS